MILARLAPGVRRPELVLALLAAAFVFPSPPDLVAMDPDPSWRYALNLARSQGLEPGRDIHFTYGPLGFLAAPLFPLAPPLPVAAYTIVLFAGWVYCLVWMWRLIGDWRLRAAAFLAANLALAGLDASPLWRHIGLLEAVMLLLACVILLRLPGFRWNELCSLAALAGVAALVKLSAGVLGVALLVSLLPLVYLEARPPWRSLFWCGVIAPAIVVAWFAVVSGPAETVVSYLLASWELAKGYPNAMGDVRLPARIPWFAAAALAVLLSPAAARNPRRLLAALPAAAALLYLAFRHATVRQDAFHSAPYLFMVALAALLVFSRAVCFRVRAALGGYAIFAALAGFLLLREDFPAWHARAEERLTGLAGVRNVWAYATFGATARDLAARERAALAHVVMPEAVRLETASRTVDSLPLELSEIFANGWRWRPAPIFHSYSAYTPRLDAMNAAHYNGPNAAGRIRLHWFSYDDRIRVFEDPLSWRAMLARYQVHSQEEKVVILDRRETPRRPRLDLVGETGTYWNRPVIVPAVDPAGLILLGVELHRAPRGPFDLLFGRAPEVWLEAMIPGEVARGRLVIANAASGGIISPWVRNLRDLALLFTDSPAAADNRPSWVRLQSDRPLAFAAIWLRFWRLSWEKEGSAGLPPVPPRLDAAKTPFLQ